MAKWSIGLAVFLVSAFLAATLFGLQGSRFEFVPSAEAAINKSFSAADGMDVVRGRYPELMFVEKFGANADVANSYETITDIGGLYNYSASAVELHISSSNANDNQVYTVYGLDADYALQSQTVTVAGFTETTIGSGLTWTRVYRVTNDGATNNAGDIYIYEDDTTSDGVPDTATKIRAKIGVGNNQTLMSVYTIPAGYTGYLLGFEFENADDLVATFELRTRETGGVFRLRHREYAYRSNPEYEYRFPLELPAKTDVELRAKTSAGTSPMAAHFAILLEPN